MMTYSDYLSSFLRLDCSHSLQLSYKYFLIILFWNFSISNKTHSPQHIEFLFQQHFWFNIISSTTDSNRNSRHFRYKNQMFGCDPFNSSVHYYYYVLYSPTMAIRIGGKIVLIKLLYENDSDSSTVQSVVFL